MTDDPSTSARTEPEIAKVSPSLAEAAPPPPVAEMPADAPAPIPSSAPVTPYRTVPDAPRWPPTAERRPSLLGATVFVSGVLLWSFLVMGELTTSYAPGKHSMLVGEALAVVFVLATSAAAWRAAVMRNLATLQAPSQAALYARGALIATGAIALWWTAIACVTALGKAGAKSLDGPITLFLLIVSIAAALGGRRLAGLHGAAPSPRKRTLARLLWAGASLVTLVTIVEILSS